MVKVIIFRKGEIIMKETQQWTSKIGFVLAAAGAAVGLGAIWKFPYVAGNGGEARSSLYSYY